MLKEKNNRTTAASQPFEQVLSCDLESIVLHVDNFIDAGNFCCENLSDTSWKLGYILHIHTYIYF